MDKKIAGLLGAVAGLATISSTQAAPEPGATPSEALQASSYADLLAPIPDPVAALEADNAARAQNLKLAQYYGYYPNSNYYPYPPPPYYHHHHHNYYSRHDHHHHHNSAFIRIPGVGGVVVPTR
ncbi:MAG: hypothetical protein JO007_17160 [Alphaproteobacteria bacterium]|nr:hypothetical protein [Alphaproteobacteria bacterium]